MCGAHRGDVIVTKAVLRSIAMIVQVIYSNGNIFLRVNIGS